MDRDNVDTNYNDKGTIIMEMIYATDYLSPGGLQASESLAAFAEVPSNARVLDVGSGLGGAAFYLAKHRGCRVHGIDLMPSNVTEANRRAKEREVSYRVEFAAGDAMALPFGQARFDLIWGQDAWCHVPDKGKMLEEFARVLAEKGQVAFSDWLLRDKTDARSDDVRKVTASPAMADVDEYEQLLAAQGFKLEKHEDQSKDTINTYQNVLKRLREAEDDICTRFGEKIFAVVLSKQSMVLEAFESGVLKKGAFAASRG